LYDAKFLPSATWKQQIFGFLPFFSNDYKGMYLFCYIFKRILFRGTRNLNMPPLLKGAFLFPFVNIVTAAELAVSLTDNRRSNLLIENINDSIRALRGKKIIPWRLPPV
jgi:hypothetical protein